MQKNKNFGIIGGDLRQIYLAKKLISSGYKVYLCGFEKLQESNMQIPQTCSLEQLISNSTYIILPVPLSRDRIKLNAPFSSQIISLDNVFEKIDNNKVVFGDTPKNFKNKNIKTYSYSSREDFMILNAVPTAEGAIMIANKETGKTLFKKRCLITGFGRIGKVLAKRLKSFESDVTISARKTYDLAWIKSLGYTPTNIKNSTENIEYDVIFNTVPSLIFDESTLKKCNKNCTIIDLASSPGGVDAAAAKNLGIKFIHALGIPGKYFPGSAAEIIFKTIFQIIKEENL